MGWASSQEALRLYLALAASESMASAAAAFEAAVPSERRFEFSLSAFLPLVLPPKGDRDEKNTCADAAAAAYLLVYLYRQHSPQLNPFESSVSEWLSQTQKCVTIEPVLQSRLMQVIDLHARQHEWSAVRSGIC